MSIIYQKLNFLLHTWRQEHSRQTDQRKRNHTARSPSWQNHSRKNRCSHPGGISINARIESTAKRYPYPSRIPGPTLALDKSTTVNTEAAPDEPDILSRGTRSKAITSLCSENPELYPGLIQAEGDVTSAKNAAAQYKKCYSLLAY